MTAERAPGLEYLDHNATTPLAPQVLDAMLPYLREHYGNPSSDYELGRRARKAIEQSQGLVASLIGAAPGEVLFTSGGTESDDLAIRGCAASAPPGAVRLSLGHDNNPAENATAADILVKAHREETGP
ncbi:MAG: aminotransferase class V-fold PLP-dependent enzyme [Acidimicrobiales bacterium]